MIGPALLLVFLLLVVIYGFVRVESALDRIARLLEPLAQEARERKREAWEARVQEFHGRMEAEEAAEAGSLGLTMDEYRDLVSQAVAAGLTMDDCPDLLTRRSRNQTG